MMNGIKKNTYITAAVIIALVLVGGAALYAWITPEKRPVRDKQDTTIEKMIKTNSGVYTSLREEGIKDAVVLVRENEIFVRFNKPSDLDSKEALKRVLTAAHGQLTDKHERIVVEEYRNTTPHTKTVVSADDLVEYIVGDIDWKKLSDRFEKSSIEDREG